MSRKTVPIGELESDRLEFKGARVLDDLHKGKSNLGSSVAAMLNGRGGELWIGIGESRGRAEIIEPLTRAADEWMAIWNHLLTTIEPHLQAQDVEHEIVSTSKGDVLLLRVAEGSDKPYAFNRQGGRRFVVRAGARIRDMTRDEIVSFGRPSSESGSEARARLEGAFASRRAELIESPARLFWIRIIVVPRDLALDTVRFDISKEGMKELLTDPAKTSTREHAMASHLLVPEFGKGVLRTGAKHFGYVEIGRAAYVDITVPLERFTDRAIEPEESEGDRGSLFIHPLPWIEHVVFAFRLVRELLAIQVGNIDEPERLVVFAETALLNARGVSLLGYTPGTFGYMFRHEAKAVKNDHLEIGEQPYRFEAVDVVKHTDRCARKLMLLAYESFGFEEKHLPTEWDPATLEFRRTH